MRDNTYALVQDEKESGTHPSAELGLGETLSLSGTCTVRTRYGRKDCITDLVRQKPSDTRMNKSPLHLPLIHKTLKTTQARRDY